MAKIKSPAVVEAGKPPYTFRVSWAIFLLAVNLLVAAYYFHIIE